MNALDLNLRFNAPRGVIFVPFRPEHLNTLTMDQPDMTGATDDENRAHIIWQAQTANAITVLENGKTLGVWGANQIWTGLHEAWFVVDDVCRKYPKSMTKVAKLWIKDKFVNKEVHRLQITVRQTDTRAYNWARLLGFQAEGVLTNFGWDKSNYYMMAITED